ncbi:MAG: hypothetical protein MJY49_05545, partial [Bacteroidales bacterium]|nr:hypothetical protein [Bacteroidales bacterium]
NNDHILRRVDQLEEEFSCILIPSQITDVFYAFSGLFCNLEEQRLCPEIPLPHKKNLTANKQKRTPAISCRGSSYKSM